MNLKSKYALALLFALAHCYFLLHLFEQSGSTIYFFYLILLPFYFIIPFEFSSLNAKQSLSIITLFLLGSLGTQFIDLWLENKVISSAAVAGVALLFLHPDKNNTQLLSLYAGTFTGMAASHYLAYSDIGLHVICAITGGLSFTLFEKSLGGFGGKLGSIGFAALIPVLILHSVLG